jgi:hypothetical protein
MAAVVGVVNLSNYDTMFAVVGATGPVDAANTYVSLQYQVGSGGTWATATTTAGATQWALDDGGYFDMGTGVLSTDAASTTVNFQLQAWTGSTSFATATFAATSTWSQTTGSWDNAATPPATPANVVLAIPGEIKLQAVSQVPEPSTIALGLLGASALLIRRRK